MDHQNLADTQDMKDFSISINKAKEIGEEYGALMVAEPLSEEEEERIDEILRLATINEDVDFWISYVTCARGLEIGLLSEDKLKDYEDQKAMLREHLGTPHLPRLPRPQLERELRSQLRHVELKGIEQLLEYILSREPF